MPSSRILGIDFGRRNSTNFDNKPHSNTATDRNNLKDEPQHSFIEFRRPSMDHIKRPSMVLGGKKHGSDKKEKERSQSKDHRRSMSKGLRDRDASSPVPTKPVKLNLEMESPPAIFIDSPQSSSGALISGRLQITPNLPLVTLNSVIMYLEATVSTKRPVADRCRECATQVEDLFEWKFLSHPKTFTTAKGREDLPFSHLIPGHLPVSTHGHIASLDYSLHVRAKTTDGQEVEFRRALPVLRALRPSNDKNSVRIFPPTNLTLNVTLPSIIHPIGEFPVTCRMTGIVAKRDDTQTRWRLRKLTWRVEEKETTISPACHKHAAKVGGDGKGVQHESVRDIGSEELRRGWKTDFSDGQIEGEFMAKLDSSTRPQCDVDSQSGLKISHCLVLELVIAEEWATNRRPSQATPTGAARVLRTQFNLNLTERAGLGIAWDDEMPPMYEDVPDSPPHYKGDGSLTRIQDYEGEDLHEDIEVLRLDDA